MRATAEMNCNELNKKKRPQVNKLQDNKYTCT